MGKLEDASSRVVLPTACPICGTEETLQHIGTTTFRGEFNALEDIYQKRRFI